MCGFAMTLLQQAHAACSEKLGLVMSILAWLPMPVLRDLTQEEAGRIADCSIGGRVWFCLQEVLSNINIVKGVKDSFGAKTFMGRVAIPVRPYYDKPGQSVTEWFDLGKQEWFHEDGTVSCHSPSPSPRYV